MREKPDNHFEIFEFETLTDSLGFDVLAMRDIDSELWNVPEFFRNHGRDLLLGQPVNELNPRLTVMRLP